MSVESALIVRFPWWLADERPSPPAPLPAAWAMENLFKMGAAAGRGGRRFGWGVSGVGVLRELGDAGHRDLGDLDVAEFVLFGAERHG